MGKIKIVELTDEQRIELEKGYKNGKSYAFRERCQMILLKSKKRTSEEVAEVFGCCEMVVNNWVKHYVEEGIEGFCEHARGADDRRSCRSKTESLYKRLKRRLKSIRTRLKRWSPN